MSALCVNYSVVIAEIVGYTVIVLYYHCTTIFGLHLVNLRLCSK